MNPIAGVSPLALAGGGAILGAIVGSFVATLCLRWPRGEGAATGRSRCDSCASSLRPAELVPIVSFLLARGRCRRCGARIAPFHLQVEIAAALIGAVALLAAPGAPGLAVAIFGWLLLPLLLLDWAHFWLPDRLVVVLGLSGIAVGGWIAGQSLEARLIGGLAGFAVLLLLALAYRKARRREGLGQGDPKLLGAIGLWVGWAALPQVVLGAAVIGLAVALVDRRRMTMTSAMPLGTLLGLAGWLASLRQAAG